MKTFAFNLAFLIASRLAPAGVRLVHIDEALVADARRVIEQVESEMPSASAEAKHARAYSRLGTLHTGPRRNISLAIELALHVG